MNESQREQLVQASATYLVEVGRILDDSERALELFQQLSVVFDTALSGEVLLTILTGNRNEIQLQQGTVDRSNAISFIKTLREVSGMGLYEAKTMYDLFMQGGPITVKLLDSQSHQHWVDYFRSLGANAK